MYNINCVIFNGIIFYILQQITSIDSVSGSANQQHYYNENFDTIFSFTFII